MTDRTDFETALERRVQAYAATAARPVRADVIARTTMRSAATATGRSSSLAGPRRPILLIGVAALLLLAAFASAAIIGRQRPVLHGSFVDGPSIEEGQIVNAVALHDGRVLVGIAPEDGLVVDGTMTLRCSPPCWPHLALLDPKTGGIKTTRDQPASLELRSMALLNDGRVLLLGHWPDGTDDPSAIYDPVSDVFEEVGAPLHARGWPMVVTLADGRVLVAGSGMFPSTAAEVFDPATGTFSAVGSMGRPRSAGVTATRLLDGRVLVVGGGPDVGAAAELFDPATGTFSPTGDMVTARGGFHSATLLPDGRVLLVGGLVPNAEDPQSSFVATTRAEIYDPATGTFSAVGSMHAARLMHAASILPDGTVLIAGGAHDVREGPPASVADAEIFDPATGTFRPTDDLDRPRLMPVTTPVGDRVLVLGDLDPSGDDQHTGRTTEWFE